MYVEYKVSFLAWTRYAKYKVSILSWIWYVENKVSILSWTWDVEYKVSILSWTWYVEYNVSTRGLTLCYLLFFLQELTFLPFIEGFHPQNKLGLMHYLQLYNQLATV